jgi:excisionase family DNA binding protein
MTGAGDEREALTVAEVAGELRLSEKTIRRAISSGSLVAHRVCAHWRIFRRDMDAWVAAGRNAAPQREPRVRRTPGRRQRGSLRALEASQAGQGR